PPPLPAALPTPPPPPASPASTAAGAARPSPPPSSPRWRTHSTMPELPEVETLRRDLARRLAGCRLGELWTSGKPLRLGRPLDVERIAAMTVGHRVLELRRLAKYLLLYTSSGGALVVHLGMSGHLLVCRAEEPRAPHTHLVSGLDRGRELRYVDPPRFVQRTP